MPKLGAKASGKRGFAGQTTARLLTGARARASCHMVERFLLGGAAHGHRRGGSAVGSAPVNKKRSTLCGQLQEVSPTTSDGFPLAPRARAVARGQKMGRPPKLTPHQQREAIKRRDRGEESLTEIGRSYNVSAATISRLLARLIIAPSEAPRK